MVMEETCSPMPSCFFILSLLPLNARITRGIRWKASPPHRGKVRIPYRINRMLPFDNAKKGFPQSNQTLDSKCQISPPSNPHGRLVSIFCHGTVSGLCNRKKAPHSRSAIRPNVFGLVNFVHLHGLPADTREGKAYPVIGSNDGKLSAKRDQFRQNPAVSPARRSSQPPKMQPPCPEDDMCCKCREEYKPHGRNNSVYLAPRKGKLPPRFVLHRCKNRSLLKTQ